MKEIRVFLGNAPWYKQGFYGVRAGSRWPHFEKDSVHYYPFPFFLAYASALLKKEGFPVLLVDAVPERMSVDFFLTRISAFSPDIIVLETSTASLENDLGIAKQIRQISEHSLISLCGPHFPMQQEEFLEGLNSIDMILVGEYEFTLLDVVNAYEQKRSFDQIPGIIYRETKGQKIVKTSSRPLEKNLELFPWPERHQLPIEKYIDPLCGIPQPSLQMWSSRGCPYNCSFCFWPQVMYHSSSYRLRNPEDVLNEIDYCLKKFNIRSVYFDDDTFNINKAHVLAIASGFIERRYNIPWGIMARADHMDEEILEKLVESGLWGVKYGIESGSQKIVDKCDKKLDLKKVRHICQLTKKLGIKMHLTFTFGLPGETKDTALQTLDFALEMNPDTVQFSIATPFPGSRFFEEMQKDDKIISRQWEEYDGYNKSVITTENLTAAELEKIRRNADETFFLRERVRKFYPEVYRRKEIESISILLPDLEENRKKKDKFSRNKGKYFFKAFTNPLWLFRKLRECRKIHQNIKKADNLVSRKEK